MNINQVSRSLEIYQNSIPTKSASQVRKTAGKGNDTMTLSDTAKDFKTVMDALKNVSDVREDKVLKLKEQISSDNYSVRADEIGEKILKANYDAIG